MEKGNFWGRSSDDKRWSKSIVKPIYQYLRGLANSFGNLTVIGL